MKTFRTAYRVSFVAGLAVLILAIAGGALKPAPVCGNLPSNYAPIIAFEMVRSLSDLQAIFGTQAGECRTAIVAQMDSTNRIDVLFYIPLYGSFLIFFLLGLCDRAPRIARAAAYVAGFACLADYVENICLFKLSANPDITDWITPLIWSTETKWVGLGLASAMAGFALAKQGGWWRIAIIPCSLGLIAALITIPSPALAGPYLSLALVFGWLIFLAISARESFRKAMLKN